MNEISLAEYRQQIESAIEDGRYEEAVAHGRRILDEYPKDLGTYWLLGRAMLEAGQDKHAVDLLRRVISADPEHMLAWVGISEVARRGGELEAAVWYMERAFELAADNETVAEELRRLYGELRGTEVERLQLTQGALARLYLRGDLVTRAISELRELLEEHPDRLDLKVALAEALWRDGQRLQASEVCQEIADGQPYNLKANLILGETWTSSGRAEGEPYLEHARAVDPENQMAQELFGPTSPLPPESPRIAPLDYAAALQEARPARLVDWAAVPVAEPFALTETSEVMDAQIEVPVWLEELPEERAPEMPLPVESFAEEAAPGEEAPDEMIGEEEAPMEEVTEGEVIKWLRQLDEKEEKILPEAREAEEIPAWLEDLELEPPAGETAFEAEEAVLRDEPEPVEIPDWLLDLVPPEAELPEKAPPAEEPETLTERLAWLEIEDVPSAEEALAQLRRLTEGEEEELPAEAEVETETLAALERTTAPEGLEGAGELPPGLESAALPSAEEALGWLQRLAEGEEEGFPAEAEVEAEAPVALEQAAALEGLERAGELPPGLESAALPSAEEALGWLEQLAEVEEAEPPVEAPAPVVEPALEDLEVTVEFDEAWLAEAIEEEAPPEDLEGYITARRAYAEEHADDHDAWLDLGRVLWQADRRATAVETYDHLIARGKLLDDVIPDLEDYAQQWPDVEVQRALGDAYVKADRLADALDIYRRALASL